MEVLITFSVTVHVLQIVDDKVSSVKRIIGITSTTCVINTFYSRHHERKLHGYWIDGIVDSGSTTSLEQCRAELSLGYSK